MARCLGAVVKDVTIACAKHPSEALADLQGYIGSLTENETRFGVNRVGVA